MVLQSVAGLLVLALAGWALSERRAAVRWRVPVSGIALQIVLALALTRLPGSREAFGAINDAMLALQSATQDGTRFVFGFLGGGEPPWIERPGTSAFVLAFQALPLVLTVSAISSLLFHWRVLPWVVRAFSCLLERSCGVGGAVGLSVSANVFVGMVEAPLLIRPYLERLTRSELFVVMTAGMASIAGTVMGLYAAIVARVQPDAMAHILVASLLSAPAAITVARMMVPETRAGTGGRAELPHDSGSAMDAVTRGTLDGMTLLLNIVAMLIVLVALVSLANAVLSALGVPSLQTLLGWVMAPVVWLAGVPWSEAPAAGALMGTKTVLNELIAYVDLANLPPGTLSERSRLIMTYALCGFANFGSLGIMIGGMGAMAPSRRTEIVALGMKSIVSGTIATLMMGAVIGLVSLY